MKHENQYPVFIVGCYRSGTTLLRSMLSSHSEVHIPEETRYIPYVLERIDTYGDLNDDANLVRLISEINSFLKGQDWPNLPSTESLMAKMSSRTIQEVIRCVALHKVEKPVRVWGDNTPLYVNCIFAINNILPSAKFINVVRDGRDVAASAIKLHVGGGFNLTALAMEWNERIFNGLAAEVRLGNKKVITIRYEDLVSNAPMVLKRICNFLDISFEENMLEFYKNIDNYKLKKQAHHKNLSKPITRDFISTHTKAFTDDEIKLLERMMQNALHIYGYDLKFKCLAPIPNSIKYKGLASNFAILILKRVLNRNFFKHVRSYSQLLRGRYR